MQYAKPTGWTHMMMIYNGNGQGKGVTLYYNGAEVKGSTTNGGGSFSAGDGRIVVGRFHTDEDERYSSVELDELIFFNRALSKDEIATMHN